ncbi:hypothetical protein HOD61_02740 [archaeon]|jgi:hypothetical protein|nr:hypothetical protein [archaeon]
MKEENFNSETIYQDEGREQRLADDEISSEEDGFMAGYNDSYEEERSEEE